MLKSLVGSQLPQSELILAYLALYWTWSVLNKCSFYCVYVRICNESSSRLTGSPFLLSPRVFLSTILLSPRVFLSTILLSPLAPSFSPSEGTQAGNNHAVSRSSSYLLILHFRRVQKETDADAVSESHVTALHAQCFHVVWLWVVLQDAWTPSSLTLGQKV